MSNFELHHGDCLEVLKTLADNSVDSIVTDPPYGLAFMGKKWDYNVPNVDVWEECLRVLKPGGHALIACGTRTQHRMTVNVEDAGFEIRDVVAWIYGSGFPKSLNVSKAIDKMHGAEREVVGISSTTGARQNSTIDDGNGYTPGRTFQNAEPVSNLLTAPATDEAKQWDGWGTALKPAMELWTLARKPLARGMTVAQNVLATGTGAINVNGCRIELNGDYKCGANGRPSQTGLNDNYLPEIANQHSEIGRFPANVIHDGSDEVLAAFPDAPGQLANASTSAGIRKSQNAYGAMRKGNGRDGEASADRRYDVVGGTNFAAMPGMRRNDSGSAARFFYCAKASKSDREEGCDDLDVRQVNRYGEQGQGPTPQQTPRVTQESRNHHPTVKPTDLMQYLCRLITPPNGTVLDPFTGSGSTGKAALLEGFTFIGIEREADYIAIARARIESVTNREPLFAAA